MRMVEAGRERLTEVGRETLDRPLDFEEMLKWGGNKAPGRNGIGGAFFTKTWAELKEDRLDLLSDMFESCSCQILYSCLFRAVLSEPHQRSARAELRHRQRQMLPVSFCFCAFRIAG
jgi:hypothetical protein